MAVMGVPRFRRFFRAAAGLDVDRDDLKRYSDFVNDKIYDMFLIAQAHAQANGRDIVEPWDLPVTKGLQESIHQFERLDEEIELQPLLDQLAARPPLDRAPSEEAEARLPRLAGGLSLALARTIRTVDPEAAAVHTVQWERAFHVFDLLL
ncbi:MAG TPA: DUF1931 family protein [Pseudonocardiaceae bacterium]|jgi:hypothetical protein